MIRNLIIVSFILLLFGACGANQNGDEGSKLVLNGEITNSAEENVYLVKIEEEPVFLDTAKIQDGKFTLEANIEQPQMWYLKLGEDRRYVPFFADAANMTVKVDYEKFNEAQFAGSEPQEELNKYNEMNKEFEEKVQGLSMQFQQAQMTGDTATIAELQKKYEELSEAQEAKNLEYIKQNNKSIVGLYMVAEQLVFSLEFDELKEIFNAFDPSLSSSDYYKSLEERIEILENVKVGKPAPDFALQDTTGAEVPLSSLNGKVVLIDFWASWCRPCREENPNVVKLYEDYKDKGFEILGVSFDEDNQSWKQAIYDDGITWPQVSDLQGWQSSAGKLYGVNSIPHTVLLNEEGVIVAKNLRGDELRAKVEEMVN